MAEHSSLAAAQSPLVDGDLATSDDLLALFEGGRPLFTDLYFPFPLLELRLLTIYNLTGERAGQGSGDWRIRRL